MTPRWSTRIFRALLSLYPGEFRDEYGREVGLVFADRHRDATGALDRSCVWLEAVAGVLREAPKEHAHMMLQDLRYAARAMRRNPGFTATAVLTLALGIGANAAVFSVINTLLLKPLAVEDPHNLYVLTSVHQDNEKPHQLSWLDYRDYRERAEVLTDLAAYTISFASLSADERADRIAVNYVTGNYFSMLGVAPAHGRLILPSEGETPGADPIVVLGHRYWLRRFNGDPAIVGRRVLVNARPVTVVGVAPASFTGVVALVDFDAYLPFGMMAPASAFQEITTDRASHEVNAIGRLAPGVTSGQAQAALDVLARQLERQYPDTNGSVRTRLIAEPLARPEPGDANSKPLVAGVFLILVGLVLLVACVNVVSLLMVRATARQRELAVRAALGAARVRLVRQLLTESLLLAAFGGAAGAAIGWWGTTLLARLPFPADVPVRFDLAFDWRVFAYIAAIALGSGIVVGLLPALRASRADVTEAMREGGRGTSDGRARQRLRGALVVMQVAVSVVLLVAAGLFVRSVLRAQSVDLGFDPRHILNLSVDVSQQGYDEARGRAFFRELESRLSRLPGVQAVSFASSVPLGFSGASASIEVEGQAVRTDQRRARQSIGYNAVGASYFETMNVPLVRGRPFNARDDARARPIAVVNEHMAATLWPGQDPVGKRFRVSGENEPWLEVAGVSKQGKYGFLFETPRSHFHVPIEQRYRPMRTLQVRSAGAPDALAPIVQKTIRELDPDLPIYDVRSMTQALDGGGGFFLPRLAALFGVGLGLLGLVLALVGLYGVVSYAATLRTREIGVRIALGAGSRDILRLVVGHGLTLVGIGIALGVSVALGVSRLIGGLLFGISPTDPATFIVVPLALAAAAFTASYIPAWRAARINPLVALQNRGQS